jgi:hypothetical protein
MIFPSEEYRVPLVRQFLLRRADCIGVGEIQEAKKPAPD